MPSKAYIRNQDNHMVKGCIQVCYMQQTLLPGQKALEIIKYISTERVNTLFSTSKKKEKLIEERNVPSNRH